VGIAVFCFIEIIPGYLVNVVFLCVVFNIMDW
jgi:hypothetical protein